MYHRNHPKRLFLRCISNQVFTYNPKTERTRCEIGASVSLIRKRNQRANCIVEFFPHTSRGKHVIGCDVFPDICNIPRCEDAERTPVPDSSRHISVQQFVFTTPEILEKLFSIDWFYPAAFQVVITAVQRFP